VVMKFTHEGNLKDVKEEDFVEALIRRLARISRRHKGSFEILSVESGSIISWVTTAIETVQDLMVKFMDDSMAELVATILVTVIAGTLVGVTIVATVVYIVAAPITVPVTIAVVGGSAVVGGVAGGTMWVLNKIFG